MRAMIACLLALLIAVPATAETLTVAANPWPPFVNEDHDEGGVSLAIIREALGRSGYDVELEIMPWARAADGVRSGEYDMLPAVWYTEARTEKLMYSERYVTNDIKFIKRAGDDIQYDGLESLDGKTIGTIRDYAYGDAFTNYDGYNAEVSNDLLTNIRKLVNGRVDLAVEDELVARHQIAKADEALLDEIEFVEPPLSSEGLFMTTGHANPKSEAIIKAFNEGLEAMKADGTFDEILSENNLQ